MTGGASSPLARHVVIAGSPEPVKKPDLPKPDSGSRVEPDEPDQKTETRKNPDGSTTTVKTDNATGTVTETTKYPDGTKLVVETKKDGTVTTTQTDPDGNRMKVRQDPDGQITTEEMLRSGVKIHTTELRGEIRAQISVPSKLGSAEVTIPVQEIRPGMVAVITEKDGTERTVRNCIPTGSGIRFAAEGSVDVRIVDRSRSFTDVPDGYWAVDAIEFVVARELYRGTGEQTFSPEQAMSRGMLARVLHNLEYNPAHAFAGVFSDVDETLWCRDAVYWAAERQVVNGYLDGSFRQGKSITREELVTMLYRYAGRPAVSSQVLNFTDADRVGSFARDAMCWAVENNIVSGRQSGALDPQAVATRAQVAVMLMRFLQWQQQP